MIESALVYVVLSDASFEMLDWAGRGKQVLAGDRKRPDVWFDKSVNLIVFADGETVQGRRGAIKWPTCRPAPPPSPVQASAR